MLHDGHGCMGQEDNCVEAEKREILQEAPCPIMKAAGYHGSLCKCNKPEFRAMLEGKMPCVQGGRCFTEFLPKNVRGNIVQYGTDTGEIRIGDFQKIFEITREIINELKNHAPATA